MAKNDRVEISGGDLDGSVLENAATEATLKKLVSVLEEKQKGAGKKAEDLHKKAIEEGTEALEDLTDDQKIYHKELKEGTKKVKDWTASISAATGVALGTTFSLITAAGSGLLSFMKDGYMAFQETAQVGAGFNNDLFELRRSAAEASIPLDEFTDIVKHNSQTFAALGGNVTQGAQEFSRISKILKDDFYPVASGLGYSLSDVNEGLASYLEIQSRLGKVDTKNTKSITDGTALYLLELDRITKVTGANRKQAEELIKKASVDPIIRSMLEETKGNAAKFAAAQANMALIQKVGGDQALTMFKELAARNPGEAAKLFSQAYEISMEKARQVFTGNIGTDELIEILKKGAKKAREGGFVAGQWAEALMSLKPGAAEISNFSASIERLGDPALVDKEQEARERITETFGMFSKTINDIYNSVIVNLLDSKVFEGLKTRIQKMADIFFLHSRDFSRVFGNIITAIDAAMTNFTENVDKEGISAAFADFFRDLFKFLGKVITPVLQDLAVDMFGTEEQKQNKAILGRMSPEERANAIKDNPSLAPPDLSTYTKGLQDLVSFIPSLGELAAYFGIGATGAVLTGAGLAVGMRSLGLAMQGVAVPALELGAAIGMTGAGVGAAMWGISKIVDAVGNSFTKFGGFVKTLSNDVNTEKLSAVGDSMKSLVSPVSGLAKAGLVGIVGAGGLGDLAISLAKFESITPDRIAGVGPALVKLHEGLTPFTDKSFGDSITGFFSSSVSGSEIESLANSLTKIQNVAGGIDRVKTVLGENLLQDAKGVETFTKSIDNLVVSLTKLEQQLKNSPTLKANAVTTASAPGSKVIASSSDISGNSPDDMQRQLNTQVAELITHIVEMKQNTKDTADSLSGRRSAI